MFTKLKILLNLVKFEHTIFALPFAYLGMIMAVKGIPTLYQWFWVTMAMAGGKNRRDGVQPVD